MDKHCNNVAADTGVAATVAVATVAAAIVVAATVSMVVAVVVAAVAVSALLLQVQQEPRGAQYVNHTRAPPVEVAAPVAPAVQIGQSTPLMDRGSSCSQVGGLVEPRAQRPAPTAAHKTQIAPANFEITNIEFEKK